MQITQNQETVKQLKRIAQLHEGNETAEQMAVMYQETREGALLAKCFLKNIAYLNVLIRKYEYFLNADDVVSFALEEMDKTLMNFDPSRNTKVLTLFSAYFNRRLYMENQSSHYQKNKANHFTTSLDAKADYTNNDSDNNGSNRHEHLQSLISGEETQFEKIELLETLRKETDLTENEFKYCEIILNVSSNPNNIKDVDIAESLSISSAAINYIKKSLQKKLYGFNKILSAQI